VKRPCQLEIAHDVSAFDCGEEALNNFLKENAWQSQQRKNTFTFVCLEKNSVIAYYSLAVSIFMHQAALDRTAGKPRTYSIPVLQISRLAVDKQKQGQKIGKHILRDALLRTCTIAQGAGFNCIVANAINEKARAFYQQFNFQSWPTDSFRLYLLMKDLRKSLAFDDALKGIESG